MLSIIKNYFVLNNDEKFPGSYLKSFFFQFYLIFVIFIGHFFIEKIVLIIISYYYSCTISYITMFNIFIILLSIKRFYIVFMMISIIRYDLVLHTKYLQEHSYLHYHHYLIGINIYAKDLVFIVD
jgi:hypothetical protein